MQVLQRLLVLPKSLPQPTALQV